jgi:hypothetical protein
MILIANLQIFSQNALLNETGFGCNPDAGQIAAGNKCLQTTQLRQICPRIGNSLFESL